MGSRVRDLTGQRIGMLTVMHRAPSPVDTVRRKRAYWACRCDCGNMIVMPSDYLTCDRCAHHCGCAKAARAEARRRKAAEARAAGETRPRKKFDPKLTQNEQIGLKTLEGVTRVCPVCKRPFEMLSSEWAYKRVTSGHAWKKKTDYYCSWRCLRKVQ